MPGFCAEIDSLSIALRLSVAYLPCFQLFVPTTWIVNDIHRAMDLSVNGLVIEHSPYVI